jgi:hypothetical protein
MSSHRSQVARRHSSGLLKEGSSFLKVELDCYRARNAASKMYVAQSANSMEKSVLETIVTMGVIAITLTAKQDLIKEYRGDMLKES